MWWGGLSAPGRFLVTLLPVMALPAAWLWARGGRAWRAGILGLLLVGAATAAMRLAIDQGGLLFNARDGFDLLLDRVNRSVNLPLSAPSLHRDVVPDALGDIAVWALAGAMATALAGLAIARAHAGRAAAWTATGWAAAVTVMLSSTVVWMRHGDASVTPHSSGLAWLHQWSPAWQTQGVQLRPLRAVPAQDLPARLALASVDRGPRQPGAAPLFSAPLVPAGGYEVVIDGAPRPSGRLSVEAGRVQQPLEAWDSRRASGRPDRPDAAAACAGAFGDHSRRRDGAGRRVAADAPSPRRPAAGGAVGRRLRPARQPLRPRPRVLPGR